jgi:hypothetical protein
MGERSSPKGDDVPPPAQKSETAKMGESVGELK